jgi:DNA mismatch repair ATPase MutS
VAAEAFAGELGTGVFTHFRREEDATMEKGKLDEELSRMSAIADAIGPGALLLCNESFAATNEREGSEIARQVVDACLEKRIKVCFVTHLYRFAEAYLGRGEADVLFLRAERRRDGARTHRLLPAPPLETSYGADLYREVFGGATGTLELVRSRESAS